METSWTSIPSDVLSPARELVTQVNGSNNYGGTTCKFNLLIRAS